MNCITPKKRTDGRSSFLQLVAYISVRDENSPEKALEEKPLLTQRATTKAKLFDRLVDYIERSPISQPEVVLAEFPDGRQRVKSGDVVCETNCFSLDTAAAEMNIVAAQSRRCEDPVYHYILSWREEDTPQDSDIFDCVNHTLNKLGMEGHQYVAAIHRDTDNVHVHIAVNRVNPETYKSVSLWKDYDTLQKCCRELERKFGFTPDNGSWLWSANDEIVRAPWRFRTGPRGARAREYFSDKESLYHYAVRHARDKLTKALQTPGTDWKMLHLGLHEKGLGLREEGGGLVVYNFLQPDGPVVKATDVHPTLSKARLEPYYGVYEGPPPFQIEEPEELIYGIFETYDPNLQLRDRGDRLERREARAAARAALKERYQSYRAGWEKPDLNVKYRYQAIAERCRAMKEDVRQMHSDPLMRKLMYRVAEFERMKAMAALRVALKQERQTLFSSGKYRPLNYRTWVEHEALKGDAAAISQLRGFAYREKRKAKERAPDKYRDSVIVCAVADDSPVLDVGTHTSKLRRDGTIEYLRDGVIGVVDHGDKIEIKSGFADYDDTANYLLAAEVAGSKSGERVEIVGDDAFVDRVLTEGCRLNYQADAWVFCPTDDWQQGRYDYVERYHVRAEFGYEDRRQPRAQPQQHDETPEVAPYWMPRP